MKLKRFHWKPEFIFIIGVILVISFLALIIGYSIHNYNEQLAITDGYVVDKQYNSPWTSYRSSGYGDKRIEIPVYHEASYYIYVKSADGKHLASYEVTSSIYDKVKIGDYLKNVNRELK